MITVSFKPTFVRQLKKLEGELVEEVLEKLELFKSSRNHKLLKVHKLHGKLVGFYSFSVNYKIRIVFEYLSENGVVLLSIGDHEVYR